MLNVLCSSGPVATQRTHEEIGRAAFDRSLMTMAQTMQPPNMQSNGTTFPGNAKAGDGSVNRKKQKRRQKQAARQALGQAPGISAETSQGNFDSGDDGLNGDSYYQTGPDDGITVNGTTYSKADLEECERLYQQGMAIPVPNADEDYYSDGDPQL